MKNNQVVIIGASDETRFELRLKAGGSDNLSAVINAPAGTSADGNARGVGSVDLQQIRDVITAVASGVAATIGGGYGNRAGGDYSVVAGGGGDLGGAQVGNHADGDYSGICGGIENYIDATATYGFVGGGKTNSVNAADGAICGGRLNDADDGAFVGGGVSNDASGAYSVIGGGDNNTASGDYAMIPGGSNNTADGDYSFAAGRQADTNTFEGVFIWSDSRNAAFSADREDQFKVRCDGGAYFAIVSTVIAQPVMTFDQGDTDQPFHKFIGDAAAATLTRDLVDEGDVTTATRIGFYKIEIQDDGNQITDGDYYVPFYSLV